MTTVRMTDEERAKYDWTKIAARKARNAAKAQAETEHPGNKLIAAIVAGLNHQNANYDEYLERDLANDPAMKVTGNGEQAK